MDNFKTDAMTAGDVEDQRCNPKWFIDHKHRLRPNQEGEANELGYFILKVPECHREPSQAFSPQGWRFGLHNRENLDINGSEAVKLAIAAQYGLLGAKWVDFCDAIVEDPKAMLSCYGLQDGVTSWTNEQIKHILTLDALFLAFYIDLDFPNNERRLWTKRNKLLTWLNDNKVFHAKYDAWVDTVHYDLYQVENQIPFVLIDKVVEYIGNYVTSQTSEGSEFLMSDSEYQQISVEYLVEDLANCFMTTTGEAFKIDNSCLSIEKTHILGAAYKTICGIEGLLIKGEERSEYIHIPSATKLKQSSIKIVGVEGPLCTMSYKKKCLFLPKMTIFDETISFIRNMAWYEKTDIPDGCLFNDYISLITDLIQSSEDLDLLVKNGVIYNTCGIKGFEMWTALEEGVIEIDSSEEHHTMKKAIVSRCDLRRYRLWTEFKILFCSKPWLVLSTIVVVLVTIATLVQTYVAVIGSNKMKPKFP